MFLPASLMKLFGSADSSSRATVADCITAVALVLRRELEEGTSDVGRELRALARAVSNDSDPLWLELDPIQRMSVRMMLTKILPPQEGPPDVEAEHR